MTTDGIEGLIEALVHTYNHLPPHTWRRVRYAVTRDEWIALRDYFFKTQGRFVPTIRGVPLVIVDEVADPPIPLVQPEDLSQLGYFGDWRPLI